MYSMFAFFWSLGLSLAPLAPANESATGSHVLGVEVAGAITPTTSAYLKDAIRVAEDAHAQALLITLDTPGGALEATREIVQAMLRAKVPMMVYVSPSGARAGSAGVFITLAADVAAMAPGTNIGAAHPVGPMGSDIQGDMKQKVENDTAAWASSIAQNQGRNTDWAEKAVRESASIPVQEALKLGVIDLVVKDVPELLAQAEGRTVVVGDAKQVLRVQHARIETYEPALKYRIMQALSNPNWLYILMLLGFLGIFVEVQFPGVILPGLLGALCLALVFGVQILPLNWFGVLLLLGAVALLVAEIYITSFGLLSLGGLVLFVVGSYLLFDVPDSPLWVEPAMIWSLAIGFALVITGVGYLLLRARRQGPTSSVDAMKGQRAHVYEAIAPDQPGTVEFQGAFWSAQAKEPLVPGEEVLVERVSGTQVFVKRIN